MKKHSIQMSCILLITMMHFCKFVNTKLSEDIVTPDFPLDWETEEERVEHKWNVDEKKWFDYIFDPHYDVTTYDLYGGTEIPAIGINTKNKNNLYESLVFAIRLGYRYIHTSLSYNNYKYIARAISAVGVRRSSIFLSLTIEPQNYGYKSVINAIQMFLKRIQFKNINLCLMGSPKVIFDANSNTKDKLYESAKIRRLTWLALESLKEDGICINLGVSYFEKKHLKELLLFAKYKPSVNMIEFHPYNTRKKLRKYMIRERIIVVSDELINPTGDNALLKDKLIRKLATKYSKTPSQIILKWAMQQGIVALSGRNNKQQIADNGQILGFELEYNDLYKINQISKGESYSKSFEHIQTIKWDKKLEAEFQLFFTKQLAKIQQERYENYIAYKQSINKQEL